LHIESAARYEHHNYADDGGILLFRYIWEVDDGEIEIIPLVIKLSR
jgi:hypothetical protein